MFRGVLRFVCVFWMVLLVSGCSGVVDEKKMEDSERYNKAPVQDVVDEWMTARNGTIKASGSTYYYAGEKEHPVDSASTDIRYDLPGEHCFLTEDDMESAKAYLNVWTIPIASNGVDLDAEIEKVAEFWKSKGWTDVQRGAEAQGERRILVTTPLGTSLVYAVSDNYGTVMKSLRMDSLCAKEFGNNSPDYLGDFEERFSSSSTATLSSVNTKGS